jgi:hypothetical protein
VVRLLQPVGVAGRQCGAVVRQGRWGRHRSGAAPLVRNPIHTHTHTHTHTHHEDCSFEHLICSASLGPVVRLASNFDEMLPVN